MLDVPSREGNIALQQRTYCLAGRWSLQYMEKYFRKKQQQQQNPTSFQCSVCQSIFMQVLSVPLILSVKLMRTVSLTIVQVECDFEAVIAARKGVGLACLYMVTNKFSLWLM